MADIIVLFTDKIHTALAACNTTKAAKASTCISQIITVEIPQTLIGKRDVTSQFQGFFATFQWRLGIQYAG